MVVQVAWPFPLIPKGTYIIVIVLTHSRPLTSPVNAPKLNNPVSPSPSLSVSGPPSRASLQPHLLPRSSYYFVAPNLLLLVHLSPGPRTPSALHTAGATPGQPAVVGALSGPRSRRRHEAGCHGAEALTRPGRARRRSGRNRRRLTPPPKAVGSPRAGTSRRVQPGRSGAPNAHFPRREGGGGCPLSEPRARLPARAAPASPATLGNPPFHARLGPAQTLT